MESGSVAVSYHSEAVTAKNTSVLKQDPEVPQPNLPSQRTADDQVPTKAHTHTWYVDLDGG